jgi:hypothetical protein
VQQLVGDDGVEHPHAAFIEHPHDGLAAPQIGGQRAADLFGARGQGELVG